MMLSLFFSSFPPSLPDILSCTPSICWKPFLPVSVPIQWTCFMPLACISDLLPVCYLPTCLILLDLCTCLDFRPAANCKPVHLSQISPISQQLRHKLLCFSGIWVLFLTSHTWTIEHYFASYLQRLLEAFVPQKMKNNIKCAFGFKITHTLSII